MLAKKLGLKDLSLLGQSEKVSRVTESRRNLHQVSASVFYCRYPKQFYKVFTNYFLAHLVGRVRKKEVRR
jgi:hypothetical protein